jgi:hypothetical protein
MKAGWLVTVFSFESSEIAVLGCATAAEMAMPLLVPGVVTHPCNWLVMSNVT